MKSLKLSLILMSALAFYPLWEGFTKPQGMLCAASRFPRTIDAGGGRKITLQRPPQRIVSVMLAVDEMLSALVDKYRVQAVSFMAADGSISNVSGWASSIPRKIQADVEQILSCEPDIVFVYSYTRAEVLKLLLEVGLPVVQIGSYDSIEAIKNNIRKVAEAVGEEERAKKIFIEMDEKLKEVDLKIRKAKKLPRVMSYGPSGNTSGSETNMNDHIVRGGGMNIGAAQGLKGFQKISPEKLIEWNPEVILLSSYAPGKETFPDELRADPSLQNVNAIKNNRVHVLPGKYVTTMSQFVVKGVEAVAQVLHPELFRDEGQPTHHAQKY